MISELPWPETEIQEASSPTEIEQKSQNEFAKEIWSVVKVEEPFTREQHQHGCAVLNQTSSSLSVSGGSPQPPFPPPLKLLSVSNLVPCSLRTEKLPPGIISRENDVRPSFSFDLQPNLQDTSGPSPSLLLQALTMSNSNDVINLGMHRFIYFSFVPLLFSFFSFLQCRFLQFI